VPEYRRRSEPLSRPECLRSDLHTKVPTNVHLWCEWADQAYKTHRPVACPGCGLYLIWVAHDLMPGMNQPKPDPKGDHD